MHRALAYCVPVPALFDLFDLFDLFIPSPFILRSDQYYTSCVDTKSLIYLSSLYPRAIISGFSVPLPFVCIIVLRLRQVLLCVQLHIVSSTFFIPLSRWPHRVAPSSHFRPTHFILIYHSLHIPFTGLVDTV